MKYEEILAWRQDVYEQTVLAAQRVPNTPARSELRDEAVDAKSAFSTTKGSSGAQKTSPKTPEGKRRLHFYPDTISQNARADATISAQPHSTRMVKIGQPCKRAMQPLVQIDAKASLSLEASRPLPC